MFASRLAHLVAGKAVYGVACFLAALAIVVAGYAHTVARLVNATGQGIAIDGSPSVGAMNILVMGLESRTDYYGNTLPNSLLTAMHAGNASAVSEGEVGAQDTNTLILIHIFAGGQKAVGFSIPRDDLVTYPHATLDGITEGKIDQAYDFAYNQSLGQTYGSSMSQDQRYTQANQAGQAFEIATVQAVTGIHVDHFVEVNLAGFFNLAQAFGGIEVCVQPWSGNDGANLADDSSGWDAVADGYNVQKGGPQYLHLAADQALAFVRARDTLPGTDLGRTKRQQAVIDYVIWELKHRNVFSDLGTLNSLLGIASQYLRTDSTFNLLDFATDMRALTGRHVSFITLPISGQVNDMELNGSLQDVNTIDLPYIQNYVHNAFYPPAPASQPAPKTSGTGATTPAPAPSTVTVDVYNGSGAPGLAGSVSQALTALGYMAGAVDNASAQSQPVQSGTQVFYGAGAAANAASIAAKAGATATALSSVPAGHVEVLLGSTVTAVPSGLTSSSPSTGATQSSDATESPAPLASSTAGANDGATGGVLTVPPSAPFGIPCVY
jgi:LCP family protein required for cell wall assembly